jgi:hypothetical protein
LSAPKAAESLGTDRTTISSMEAGRFGISEQRLRRLVSIYECDDPTLVDALAKMTGGRNTGWWDGYRGKIPPDFLEVSDWSTMLQACELSRPRTFQAYSRQKITPERSLIYSSQHFLGWRSNYASRTASPGTV